MHSLKDGGEPGGGWAAGGRELFLALLLWDAGQAMTAYAPLGSTSSHTAFCITDPTRTWPAWSLCSEVPGGEAGEGILKYLHIPFSIQGGRHKKAQRLKVKELFCMEGISCGISRGLRVPLSSFVDSLFAWKEKDW